MLSRKLGKRCDRYMDSFAKVIKEKFPYVSPNVITIAGIIPHIIAALLYAKGSIILGGVFVILGGFFDMLDGAFARTTGEVTRFGGVLDSTIDRYNDFLPWLGITYYFSKRGQHLWVMLSLLSILGIFLVPYIRARSEKIIDVLNSGIMERPERVLSLFFFSVIDKIKIGIVVICILSHVTALQRIIDARKRLL